VYLSEDERKAREAAVRELETKRKNESDAWDQEYRAIVKRNAEKSVEVQAAKDADALQKRKDAAREARELFDPRTQAQKAADFERDWNAL
jgi:hypothetical protein